MAEDQGRNRSSMGDEVREGIRAGLGILSALKDAIEETVQDMMDRGELSPERAREAVRTTMDRAQNAFEDARTRLDFVPRREFEALRAEVAALTGRLDRHMAESGAHHDHGSATPGPGSGGAAPGGRGGGPGAGSGGPGPDIPVSEG